MKQAMHHMMGGGCGEGGYPRDFMQTKMLEVRGITLFVERSDDAFLGAPDPRSHTFF